MSATGPLDPSELLAAQRRLRDRLLSGHTDDAARRERDLAAQMLLYLDDARSCWAVCARWLLPLTGADRIDAGFSSGRSAWYRPEFELTRADVVLPKVLDATMDARDNGIAVVWAAPRVVVFDDVASDVRIGPGMRATLLAAGAARKLAVALRDRGRDVGRRAARGTGMHALGDGQIKSIVAPSEAARDWPCMKCDKLGCIDRSSGRCGAPVQRGKRPGPSVLARAAKFHREDSR